MNAMKNRNLTGYTDIEKPDWDSFSRCRSWVIYEAMFLLLGALPVIDYSGKRPSFALIVSWPGEDSDPDAVKRFFRNWERLYRDVDESIEVVRDLSLLDGDEKRKTRKHDWPLYLVRDMEFMGMKTGADGGARWEELPPKRIGKDICLKRCRPIDFLKWAESRGYEIPEELRPLLDEEEEERSHGAECEEMEANKPGSSTAERNKALQGEANALARERLAAGQKVTKRKISAELARTERWKKLELKEGVIERIIKKQW